MTILAMMRRLLALSLLVVTGSHPHAETPVPAATADTISIADPEASRIQAIAEEAALFGLPMVANYALMYAWTIATESPQFKAPFNQLYSNKQLYTPKDTGIPYPNNDTIYSTAWLDLRAEPVVISAPAIAAPRYYSMALIDSFASNYAIVSSRKVPRKPANYLVVGPDWKGKTPAGITQVFHAPSQFSLALIRLQVTNTADTDNVNAIQAQLAVKPLSAFLGRPAPPAAAPITFPKIDRDLAKINFFGYLDFALQFVAARPEDREIRAKLASIGIGNGDFATFLALAGKYRRELAMGAMAAEKRLAQVIANAGPVRNGWNWTALTLDTDNDNYQGDYVKRAAIFKFGPYGLNAKEALYPAAKTLPDGEPLDTSKHRYTLTFAPGQLPPVDNFWSLTAYDSAAGFVDNPLQRYLINALMLPSLHKNADGSLTLYIQKDAPSADQEANWLPAPDGPLQLILRLYGPKPIAYTSNWTIPPLVRAD